MPGAVAVDDAAKSLLTFPLQLTRPFDSKLPFSHRLGRDNH